MSIHVFGGTVPGSALPTPGKRGRPLTGRSAARLSAVELSELGPAHRPGRPGHHDGPQPVPEAPLPLWRVIAFTVLWQAAWFAAVVPAGRGLPWVGLLATLPVVLLAGWGRWSRALHVVGAALAVGVASDALLGLAGAVGFSGGLLDGRLAPPWMWMLWIQLGLALDLSLAWLRRRWWLPPLAGALSAPGAYLGGLSFGALAAPNGPLALALAVGATYAVALPLLVLLTPRQSAGDGVPAGQPAGGTR